MKKRKVDYIIFFILNSIIYLWLIPKEIMKEPSIKNKIGMIIGIIVGLWIWTVIPGTITNFIFRRRKQKDKI